jgi:hypothetical protein
MTLISSIRVASRFFYALLMVMVLAFATTGLAQTQRPSTSRPAVDRARVADMIRNGEFAAAEKTILEYQAASAAAPPGVSAAPASEIGNVQYEEIKACGFYPQETRLECVIEIKQAQGHGGPIGSFGSAEHVYFCVD